MRIALIDSTPNAKMYPLSLLKISAWQKDLGNECRLYSNTLPKKDEFDEIWVTTCFTYDIPHAVKLIRTAIPVAKKVKVGGIAASLLPKYFEKLDIDLHIGLIEEAEKYHPDYHLLGHKPEYSISHTSRGCIRNCGFCMVHRLEPTFINRDDWEKDLHPETTRVLFYDNNWLAKPIDDLKKDVSKLSALVKSGRVKTIDFNQGLDCRLMTEELADLLHGLPIKPVRFAFDGMHEDGHYQRAVEMMVGHGFKEFMTYVLYNFKDTPEDFYYRLKESVKLTQLFGAAIKSFPMRYQPILDINNSRNFTGKNWTLKIRNAFMSILNQFSIDGQISSTGRYSPDGKKWDAIDEFEYWLGKNEKEFIRLLNYDKIRILMKRKKSLLRLGRSRHEI